LLAPEVSANFHDLESNISTKKWTSWLAPEVSANFDDLENNMSTKKWTSWLVPEVSANFYDLENIISTKISLYHHNKTSVFTYSDFVIIIYKIGQLSTLIRRCGCIQIIACLKQIDEKKFHKVV